MERNKLLKNWSGRIKVAQLARLMEEDIKECAGRRGSPSVEVFFFLSEGGVVALWRREKDPLAMGTSDGADKHPHAHAHTRTHTHTNTHSSSGINLASQNTGPYTNLRTATSNEGCTA